MAYDRKQWSFVSIIIDLWFYVKQAGNFSFLSDYYLLTTINLRSLSISSASQTP